MFHDFDHNVLKGLVVHLFNNCWLLIQLVLGVGGRGKETPLVKASLLSWCSQLKRDMKIQAIKSCNWRSQSKRAKESIDGKSLLSLWAKSTKDSRGESPGILRTESMHNTQGIWRKDKN